MPEPLHSSYHEPNLVDILGGVKRRFYLVCTFIVVFFFFGLIAVWLSPRKYESQTMVALETSEQNFSKSQNNNGNTTIITPPVESILLSQVEVLQSQDLAENILKDLNLVQNPLFWQGTQKPTNSKRAEQKALMLITDNLTIRPVGRSLVIEIRYRHANPDIAAMIANRFAELYQEQQVKEKILNARKTALWLGQRMALLNNKLRESARAVEEYRAKEDLIDGAKAEITSQQISDISTQLMQAQAEEAGIKARKDRMDAVLQEKKSLDNIGEVMNSRLIGLLKRDESVLLSQLAQLKSKYGPNHPKILAMQAELGELKAKQSAEMNKITGTVDNELLAIQAKIQILSQNLKSLEDKRHRENHAAIGLRELEREADTNRQLYESFLNRYKENKMLGDIQQPDTKIISMAKVPVLPSGPNPLLIVAIFNFVGAVLGIFTALFLEQLTVTIRTAEQVQAITGLTVLSTIPKIKNLFDRYSADYIFENPLSTSAESIRNLCLRIINRIETKPVVLTFTSHEPDESKTILTIWLAKLMAKSGLKVVLLDGNLRKPGLAPHFDIFADYSVSDILLGKKELTYIKDRKLENLSVISGLASDLNDISTLSGNNLVQIIQQLKAKNDIVIIDTSSFNIAESQLFTGIADHCLVTLKWDHTKARALSSISQQMHRDKNIIMGYIITESDES